MCLARYQLILTVVIFCGSSCGQLQNSDKTTNMRLTVPISGHLKALKGIEWPETSDHLDESLVIADACSLTIQLPSNDSWSTSSYFTVLSQKDSVINRVVVTPLASEQSFRSCVELLKSDLNSLRAVLPVHVSQRLSEWTSKDAHWDGFSSQSLLVATARRCRYVCRNKAYT